MSDIIHRPIVILRKQLAYGITALAPHAGTHTAARKSLALVWAHASQFGHLSNFFDAYLFAATNNCVGIRRMLKIFQWQVMAIKKAS